MRLSFGQNACISQAVRWLVVELYSVDNALFEYLFEETVFKKKHVLDGHPTATAWIWFLRSEQGYSLGTLTKIIRFRQIRKKLH